MKWLQKRKEYTQHKAKMEAEFMAMMKEIVQRVLDDRQGL